MRGRRCGVVCRVWFGVLEFVLFQLGFDLLKDSIKDVFSNLAFCMVRGSGNVSV